MPEINIGKIKINTNIFLAPLSGCTDLAFRLIARKYGAKFCFFEMIDANSIFHSNRKNKEILATHKKDIPIAAQIVGADPAIMAKAAAEVAETTPALFIDINAACPVRKIVRKKAGAYLLKEPKLLYKIIKAVAAAIDIPVTVKIRIGYESVDLKALKSIAKGCEKSGAAALFVHGRTRSQGYSGEINYKAIKAIKKSVKIPVLGSGNVFTPELAKRMIEEGGCDGVMVARGAFGHPWIYKEIEEYFKSGKLPKERTLEDRIKTLKLHLKYLEIYRDAQPMGKVGIMRKIAIWHLKSFPNAAKTRGEIGRVQSYAELIKVVDALL
ncbi:MAG: tRNA dihydrouridine synthase DusB [Candidatus Margulisiibacteriota bacterium]